MKRFHRFIVLTDDSEWLYDEVHPQLHPQLMRIDDPMMAVIECKHEWFWDNVVEVSLRGLDKTKLLRDRHGQLWYFYDFIDRHQAIDIFE